MPQERPEVIVCAAIHFFNICDPDIKITIPSIRHYDVICNTLLDNFAYDEWAKIVKTSSLITVDSSIAKKPLGLQSKTIKSNTALVMKRRNCIQKCCIRYYEVNQRPPSAVFYFI